MKSRVDTFTEKAHITPNGTHNANRSRKGLHQMAVVALDPTEVTNPPRGTDPAELAEFADMIAKGEYASDGVEYADKPTAVKAASKIVRGINWLRRSDIRPGARYATRADGSVVFYIKDLGPVEDDE